MTILRRVRAPGKLVLVGEYAVLDGGPAVVLAIDRGVECVVHAATELVIETPDGDTRFVAPALAGSPVAHYRFSAWNPVDLPGKPGFGGSAAACVAACIAGGRPGEEALTIHAEVQGGGSGIDVRAALAGGMIRVEGEHTRPLPPVLPSVIFSGASARTGPRVSRYLAWADRTGFISASREAASAFTSDPMGALETNLAALQAMARAAGLDYLTSPLARIVQLAREHGGAAKPSGAGGGDCAVALFPDMAAQRAFEAACQVEGFVPIPVSIAPGAHVLPPESP